MVCSHPRSFKASVMLEELGLPYNVHEMKLSENQQKEEWFLVINPNGRIPALGEQCCCMHAVVPAAGLWGNVVPPLYCRFAPSKCDRPPGSPL